jgi:chloride channel 3/4/5
MTGNVEVIPSSGLTINDIEKLLKQDEYKGFPIVEDMQKNILVGYIGRTELRYAVTRVKRDRAVTGETKCFFAASESHAPVTPITPHFASDTSANTPIDFSRFIDPTPVTVHPRLPLET